MTLKVFRDEVTRQILLERKRGAEIADAVLAAIDPAESGGELARTACQVIAAQIRAARRPSFRIVKPETIEKYPELLKNEDLVVSNLTARQVRNGAQISHYDPMRGVAPVDTPGVTLIES